MNNRIILWLEDRPATVDNFNKYCVSKGFTVVMVPTLKEFMEALEENIERICLIIIDIMLYGINNLETFRIMGSDTSAGYNAGWIIIERLLRPTNFESPYVHIPVAVISARTATIQDKIWLNKLSIGVKHIQYFEKFGTSTEGKTWKKEFEKFIDMINETCFQN